MFIGQVKQAIDVLATETSGQMDHRLLVGPHMAWAVNVGSCGVETTLCLWPSNRMVESTAKNTQKEKSKKTKFKALFGLKILFKNKNR